MILKFFHFIKDLLKISYHLKNVAGIKTPLQTILSKCWIFLQSWLHVRQVCKRKLRKNNCLCVCNFLAISQGVRRSRQFCEVKVPLLKLFQELWSYCQIRKLTKVPNSLAVTQPERELADTTLGPSRWKPWTKLICNSIV